MAGLYAAHLLACRAVMLVAKPLIRLVFRPQVSGREWLVEKLARDAKIADLYEGTQEINLLIVARQVLNYSSSELPA